MCSELICIQNAKKSIIFGAFDLNSDFHDINAGYLTEWVNYYLIQVLIITCFGFNSFVY